MEEAAFVVIVIAAQRPPLVHWLVQQALYYPYFDLRKAQDLFLSPSSRELAGTLPIQPLVLIEEEASGCGISVESVRMTVSYQDLGMGFAELATREEWREIKAVVISSKGGEGFEKYGGEIGSRVVRILVKGFVTWALSMVW